MVVDWSKRAKVAQNALEAIGQTPLIKLNKVTKGLKPEILVKVEWFSPTGSLKDRIYYRMITEAVKKGLLKLPPATPVLPARSSARCLATR